MPGLSVRRAVPADVDRLAHVHFRCWQETYRGMLSDAFLAAVDPAGRVALWHQLLDRPEPAEAWAACDDGVVVGSPEGHPPPSSGDLELWGLYLLASHQGLGLGRRLLEAALGARAASLWVAADNRKAISFYTRLGFTPDGAEDKIAGWENLREIRMVRPAQPGI
jgi:ribosomal protein S18 acetylase RimI-like enzyme